MNRELSMEFVRVTEAAAIACGRLVGRGDKNGADGLAVDAISFSAHFRGCLFGGWLQSCYNAAIQPAFALYRFCATVANWL